METERQLLTVRRRVPLAAVGGYRSLWEELRASATAGGARAWRFVSAVDPEVHLEFLEFKASADPRHGPGVRNLMERLDAEAGASAIELWLEDR